MWELRELISEVGTWPTFQITGLLHFAMALGAAGGASGSLQVHEQQKAGAKTTHQCSIRKPVNGGGGHTYCGPSSTFLIQSDRKVGLLTIYDNLNHDT